MYGPITHGTYADFSPTQYRPEAAAMFSCLEVLATPDYIISERCIAVSLYRFALRCMFAWIEQHP